ncbi:MAG: sensor histidine kinase [Planctomycetota bacterium]|jgi:two-component system NtrC family sensor kinase
MRQVSLKLKIGVFLAITLTVAMLLFTLLVVRHNRQELLQEATGHVNQLSEVITRSTRFAMLQNQPAYVGQIIQDVGNQANIEKVRILSNDGTIIHSTYQPEIGRTVHQKAEECGQCHRTRQPLEQVPACKRPRIIPTSDGRRLLGSMEVIRNEPSCYTAACHQHDKSQSVLGVLDILYSLDEIDQTIQSNSVTVAGSSLGFIVVASLFLSFLVHRMVYVPLRDLESGAKRLSSGNLEQLIPVRSGDEFGRLATSFNTMTQALKQSELELREWGHTLEQKVEKRTGELRIAEAEAARGEKLASIGLLAAGIAHELNNPLTGILTFSHLMRKKVPDDSPEAEDLDLVIRETKRCATIIRRLLDFSREKAPEKKFADLNEIIETTVRIVERPAHLHNIEITLDLDQDLPPVWVEPDLIEQVIINMLVNAQHAIEDGGSITISCHRSAEPRIPDLGMDPVPMVEISVIDTGCGIPEEDLQRIFDPFFSSKEVGKGTGLGLSVSHGIVRAHGGCIEVESAVGMGTTFRICLPLNPPSSEPEENGGGGQ